MTSDDPMETAVGDRLRLGTGFAEEERGTIVERFGALDARLRSFAADTVDLELSVKERDGADQRVTLECWLAGQPRIVATSARPALGAALIEVRDDMVRQIDELKTRQEPRNNAHLRKR